MRSTMPIDLESQLERYAALTVRIGLNLQPGQRLLIIGPLANGGVALEAAALVRHIAAAAYDAGAELVEPIWGDEALQAIRFAHAPRASFQQFSAWLPNALVQHAEAGHARNVDLRERSRSTQADARGSGRRRSSRRRRKVRGRFANTSRVTARTGRWLPRPRPVGRRGCFRISRPPISSHASGRRSSPCADSIGRIRSPHGRCTSPIWRRVPKR